MQLGDQSTQQEYKRWHMPSTVHILVQRVYICAKFLYTKRAAPQGHRRANGIEILGKTVQCTKQGHHYGPILNDFWQHYQTNFSGFH